MLDKPFSLGDRLRIACSGEEGVVIGRAEYADHAPSVLIRYKSSDGRATESWWDVSAVEVAQ